ncbi:hypothetical protein D3C71_1726970 [compost metagenome]
MRAGNLLLTLNAEFDVHRQGAFGFQEGLHGFHLGVQLRLVVGCASPVQPAVLQHRLEGIGFPLVYRVGRLHVIMPVNQRCRLAGIMEPITVYHRVAFGFQNLNMLKPGFHQPVRQPAGGFPHVFFMRRTGAYAGNPDEIL